MHLASSSFQTQDYKTFLEPLSSPNITLWKKERLNIYSTVLFKVMMNHSCIKDQKLSTVRGKNSAPLSKWLPVNKQTLWLSGLFRNLDFISCLGRGITIQPQPQFCHLPLDYSLVLRAIRAEWVNNEKRVTLPFISSSIVLLVLWLSSPFIRMTCSTDYKLKFFICKVCFCQWNFFCQLTTSGEDGNIKHIYHPELLCGWKNLKLNPTKNSHV